VELGERDPELVVVPLRDFPVVADQEPVMAVLPPGLPVGEADLVPAVVVPALEAQVTSLIS